MAKRKGSKRSAVSTLCKTDSCCPVINISCRVGSSKKTDTFTGKDGKKHKYTYVAKGEKLCTVRLGSKKVVAKDVTSESAGKKVNALRKSLIARRCVAKVVSKSGKKAAAT